MLHSYVVIDLETTGFYRTDRVIEIAILSVDDGRIQSEFCTLIDPQCSVGDSSIHGITQEEVIGAPSFEEIAGDVVELLRGKTIAGHNVFFDLRFLRQEFQRLNIDMPDLPSWCTLKLANKYGPENRRLVECCKYFGIDTGTSHSALHDAQATYELLMVYRLLCKQKGKLGWIAAHVPGDNWFVAQRGRSEIRIQTRAALGVRTPSYVGNLILRLPPVKESSFRPTF